MIIHMQRTTLLIHEQRLIELKKIAAEENRTLSDLVDEMLRTGISRYEKSKRRKRSVSLPTFAMGEPVINIADHDRLEEAMGTE